jgi:hypothetical protein
MAIRSFVAASVIAIPLAAASAEQPMPPVYHGPRTADGQDWSVTFELGGSLSAISTCKPAARALNPSCRYHGGGTWRRDAAGRVCFTITEWESNRSYGGSEKCI